MNNLRVFFKYDVLRISLGFLRTSETNPDSANGTRLCMTVLVASLTLKSISLFKVLNESRVDLERQTLLIIFSYIPVTV